MAITQIKGSNIADGTVVAADVADGAVTTTKVADNAVTGAKIAMGSDAAGDIITYNGTDYIRLAKGTAAQVLKMNAGATAVEWAADAGGIAVPGSSVAGDTLYHNGTIYTRLAKGTAAQVLAMNAGATAPEWADAAGGGSWTHISRAAPSSAATVDFTGFDANSYDSYVFIYDLLPATDSQLVKIRCSTDGGSTFADGSEYRHISTYQLSSAATPTGSALAGTNAFHPDGGYGTGNAANEGSAGVFWIYAPDSAVYTKVSFTMTSINNSGNHLHSTGSGHLMLASDVDAVRFLFGSGNIASGEINMYGVKNSS